MSVQQAAVNLIRATGQFTTIRQPTTDVLTCRLVGHYGATIYVPASGVVFHIRVGALENQRFPNNDRLYLYARENGDVTEWQDDNAYVLDTSLLPRVLDIILGSGWMNRAAADS